MADNKGDDGLWMVFFLLAVTFGVGWLMWHNFRPQITNAVVNIRSAEMKLASLWWDDEDIISVPISKATDDERALHAELGDNERVEYHDTTFGVWKRFAENAKPQDVQPIHLKVLSYVALYSLRWPMLMILMGLFVWVIFKGPTSRFHRILGLEGLMVDQAKTFRVIKPFLKFNPNNVQQRPPGSPVPTELPMFAEALSPEEWIAYNEVPLINGKLDQQACEAAFADQLGPRWEGHAKLPTELKIILAAFCLKASRKRQEADDLLGRLSACWDHESGLKLGRDKGIAGEARKILRDSKLSEKVLTNCARHAYVSTALMRGLDTARSEGGVLAPAQFVWLRAHNRQLWYPLNNMGRQAFHAEALGCASHYRAEKQINRPIVRPRVGDAVEGMMEHMANTILARPIPPLQEGKRKRRGTGNAVQAA